MEIGHYLAGRYKIIKKLGYGGMANVYLAKDLILDREVAVKVLRIDLQSDEENLRRFRREAEATVNLFHSNIVQTYDVGMEPEPYIVMEYVDGQNLKEYLEDNHPLAYEDVVSIMTQVTSAVHYAHERGIIHRDLKPQNILINKNNEVKITDFGISLALSKNSITQTNSMLGSVQYISPEQTRGGMASRQTDIYSLGIILFEMLAGHVPFDGESAVSVALQHFQNPLPELKDERPDLPQALENVVLKATAKNPEDRYRSAKEMEVDLRTSLSSNRKNEAPFVPPSSLEEEDIEETRVLPELKAAGPVAVQAQEQNEPEPSPSDQATESRSKSRRRWPWLLLLLPLALLIFIGVRAFWPGDVEVPDLQGLSQEEAIMLLDNMDLEVGDIREETHEDIEEGHVIRTNPRAGFSVKEGASIDLILSSGPERMELGNYVGDWYDDVHKELTDLGFTVEREEVHNDEVDAGRIIDQSIAEGEVVLPSETTITFTVSKGAEPIELRDFSGYSRQGVLDYAQSLGLRVNVVEEYSDSVAENMVISQAPSAGTIVYPGDVITVHVSMGQELVEVPVPNVVGLTASEAQTILEDLGFTVEIQERASREVDAGRVISLNQRAGTRLIPENTTIVLTVSTGVPAVSLRDLTRQSLESVQAYAAANGLVLEVQEEASDVPRGQVIRQNPPAGTQVSNGDTLEVVISSGPRREAHAGSGSSVN